MIGTEEFSPPLRQEEVTGKTEGPEGHISSISLLLTDANDKLFSLHVKTDANFIASVAEDLDDDNEREPVFVVPSMSIDSQVLTDITQGVTPGLLKLYLVPQDE